MDPNATLEEIRILASAPAIDAEANLELISQLFQGLDGWLSGGGFLPTAWNKDRSTA